MLKVLHVTAVAERGGLEVVLLNILRSLDRSRFVAEVLLLEDGPFVREVQETGTKTHVISAGRVRNVVRGGKAIATAARLIREHGIDIVQSHNAKAHIYGGLAARIAGVPSVYHLHGVPNPSLSRDGLVSILSVMVPAQRTIACSSYVARAFGAVWRTGRQVIPIRNGVMLGTPPSNEAGVTVRQEFGIPTEAPLVVMPARLQRWKGVHVFLDAAAAIVEKYPEAHFMVVGGALFGLGEEYANELRLQVDRLHLGRAVVFTGYRADVSRFFEAADVVVHSSIEPDPFPTVLLEAMAWGKPVIASDLGGPREIVVQGVTGYLVPPGRAELQSQAIMRLIATPGLRMQMGKAGSTRFQAEFRASRMTAELEALYVDVVGETHD
jgi:glycosyltransferase involved in cell wall biosynthesis